MIIIDLPITLEPKQGDRSRIAGGPGKQFVAHYQPAKVTQHARNLAALLAPYRPLVPMDGPICMMAEFIFPWPAGTSQKARKVPGSPKHTKPDLDNLEKQLCDVLQSCGFIANDSRIASKHTSKTYADQGHVHIKLWTWDETKAT